MSYSSVAVFLIILIMILILSSLGLGLYYLLHDRGKTPRTARALTFRILLSLFLFIMLFVAFAMGWIAPHPILGY